MKRLLLAVLLSLCAPAVWATHFNCTLDSACTQTNPCDFATPGNWNDDGLCNGQYPGNGNGGAHTYTATIPANRVVNLATDAITLGLVTQNNPGLIINGTMTFSKATSGRDADGYRSLSVVQCASPGGAFGASVSVAISTTGKLFMGPSDRLLASTAGGTVSTISFTGNAILDAQGSTDSATVQRVFGPYAGGAGLTQDLCGVGAADYQYYIVSLDKGMDVAKVGRRIFFNDGELRNQSFEIVQKDGDISDLVAPFCTAARVPEPECTGAGTMGAVSNQTIARGAVGFCTYRLDSLSANDSCTGAGTPAIPPYVTCCSAANAGTCTLGQRLTGHVTTGLFPAAGPPANSRHWTTTPVGNDVCSGAQAPDPFCTAANAGTGYRIFPRAGDKVTLIDDAWFAQTAGTVGFAINGVALTNFPRLRAVNMIGVKMSVSSTANPSTDVVFNPEYLNVHECPSGSCLTADGFQNMKWRKNTIHDGAGLTGIGGGIFIAEQGTTAPDNTEISDSHFYRNNGNSISLMGTGAVVSASGVKVIRNLIHDDCTNDDECNAIEMDHVSFSEVSDNLIQDISSPNNANGQCLRAGGDTDVTTRGLVFHHNIVVNCMKYGINFDSVFNEAENVTATANYVSNVWQYGIHGGRLFGNFIRNWGLDKSFTKGVKNAVLMKGNFLFAYDTAVESGYCAGVCSGWGVQTGYDSTYLNDSHAIDFSDNLIRTTSGNAPGGVSITGATNGAINVDHTTYDAGGKTSNGAVSFALGSVWDPTISTTANVRDTVGTHGNNGKVGDCVSPADASALISYGTYVGNRSSITAEIISDAGPIGNSGNCTSVGTRVNSGTAGLGYRNREALDYQLVPGSAILTLGAFPSGSALGSRAWRFNWSRFIWEFPFTLSAGDATGETTTMLPPNFSNGTCDGLTECNQDTDGDGVGDLWDNCDRNFNPNQWDEDGDGIGCACDDSGDTCS